MKPKHKPPKRHRERDMHAWRRNAAKNNDPADELMVPAPILTGGPSSTSMALVPYAPPMLPARAGRASITQRAAAKARGAARAAVAAVKPNVVNPLDGPHLLQVAAGAGGGIAASLAAHQFADDVGQKKLAYLLIGLGAAGTVFLDKHWQRMAAGVLASGTGQLSAAYLTERTQAKLAKETKLRQDAERAALAALQALPAPAPPAATSPPPAAVASAPTPPRNAHGYIDDGEIYRAVDRAHQAVDGGYAYGERNAYAPYGDGAIDIDLVDAYGQPA